MARSFSKREAGELIARHRRTLSKLHSVKTDLRRWQTYTANAAAKLAAEGAFAACAERELASGRESFAQEQEIVRLLTELMTCRQLSALAAYVEGAFGPTAEEITQDICALTPALGGLSWAFASGKKKAAARRAYERLSELDAGELPRQAETVERQAADAARPEEREVLRSFYRDRAAFWDALQKAAPDMGWDEPPAGPLGQLLAEERSLAAAMEQCRLAIERSQKDIRESAERFLDKRVTQKLGEIPVESLRGVRRGLRLKTLREEGFATMADVYAAGEARLADIRGISDEGAADIKRLAALLAAEVRGKTRLSLKAAERSDEACEVAAAVFAYLMKADEREEYRRLLAEGLDTAPGDAQALTGIGNGAKLLFLRPAARKSLYESYRRAEQRRGAQLASRVLGLSLDLRTEPWLHREEAWECFERNPEAFFDILKEFVPGAL